MTFHRLDAMVKGWFVGNFSPTVLSTDACEVAVKHYDAGAYEAAHVHRIATEISLIVSGSVVMNGRQLTAGDIVRIDPGEATDFRALTETSTVVVKLPCVAGDKYDAAS